jgi:hypothetical protein
VCAHQLDLGHRCPAEDLYIFKKNIYIIHEERRLRAALTRFFLYVKEIRGFEPTGVYFGAAVILLCHVHVGPSDG